MGIWERIRQKLVAYEEKKYRARLVEKKVTYDQWIADSAHSQSWCSPNCREGAILQELPQQGGGGAVPSVLLLQVGEGALAAGAEAEIQVFFANHPEVLIAYGDEDVRDLSTGLRSDPWYKPDWSPDTFLSGFYWGGVVAVRREWLEQTGRELVEEITDLVTEAGGFQKGCRTIGHIPKILFHGVSRAQQEKLVGGSISDCRPEEASGAGDSGWAKDFDEAGEGCSSLISIIIPSKDHPDILFQGLRALVETKGDRNCQVIVVDNGSCEENRLLIETFLQRFPIPCEYLYRPMEFNFSRMCNLGAQEAEGELLLFLNDDVEAACAGWLGKMAEKAIQPYVGAVGLKLYYPGGKRIQHVGIVNLPEGPIHKLQFMTDDRAYDHGYNRQARNVLAVTGACLMVQREKYRQAGGMNEALQVTFNDVDLCFRLWELGYHNVIINDSYAYHHESLSRGEDKIGEKADRLAKEQETLYRLHPALKGFDPYYSRWMNREVWDTGIRPIYVTAGNCIQEAAFQEITVDLQQYRRDDCLLLSLQKCESACIQGYSVVLGDNNACYDRRLILWREKEMTVPESGEGQVSEKEAVQVAYEGVPQGKICCLGTIPQAQYRPDLEENMTDQTNVALCGFWLKPCGVPPGVYRPGILARSRVSNTKLVNWSHKLLVCSTDQSAIDTR